MIEATGMLTLVTDEGTGHVAVPDVKQWEEDDGRLYHQLLELIGKEVYVLVLPKDEMVAMCECGHSKAEHMEFTNWQVRWMYRDSTPQISEPDFSSTREHRSYYGTYSADDRWCKCRQFKEVLK